MTTEEFYNLYNNLKGNFNLALIKFFKGYDQKINENLLEAIKYSIVNSGKRIRPILCFLGARFAGIDENLVMTQALALEMIHTYSLIHDDLPALDNSSTRRGKLTTHLMHGEAMAILAGDALLNLAYEIMTREVYDTGDFNRLKAMQIIMRAAGVQGLVNGQAKDVDYLNHESYLLDHIISLYRNKTADLIRVSLVSGALIGKAKKDQLEILSSLGDSLGIYFQIQDDLLDKKEEVEEYSFLQKDEENEEENTPITVVSFLGRDEALTVLSEYEENICEALGLLGIQAEEIEGLFMYIKDRKN